METVGIDKVNVHDGTFCVSYPLEDDLLLASVTKFGILVPVGLLERDPPVIVTGFKRLEAARRLGIREIPCVFLNISERQALLTAINDNLARSLNTIEKALCIHKMVVHGFSTEDIYEVMAMLGLPRRESVLRTGVEAACAEEEIKAFIVGHRLPITAVEQLFWFDAGERHSIVDLLEPRRETVSMCREVLHLLMLLKTKQGAIDFHGLGRADDGSALKQGLILQVHPLLSDLQEKLAGILAACALPPAIRVRVDQGFEREPIDISIHARNDDELEEALKKLEGLQARGLFRSIFELTHGLQAGN
ncbi:MAG: ParB/RepB/Spo0J family partition protein [Syntrophorhabdales bacterium]|jgi:hypothetical protein